MGLPARKIDVLSFCSFISQIEHHKTRGDLGDASSTHENHVGDTV